MPEWQQAVDNLTQAEKDEALNHLLEIVGDTEAGIIRQILGAEKKPLSEKQKNIYKNNIEHALVERCGVNGCSNFVRAGVDYCPTCEIKYGR